MTCSLAPAARAGEALRFTLIELLIVVAVIAILLALLLPALKNATDYAKAIQCVNNFKQVILVTNTYANDYDGKIPSWYNLNAKPAIMTWYEVYFEADYIPGRSHGSNLNAIRLAEILLMHQRFLSCPSWKRPESVGKSYGMALVGDKSLAADLYLPLYKLNEPKYLWSPSAAPAGTDQLSPSKVDLYADSVNFTDQTQHYFYSRNWVTGQSRHMRHANRANQAFLDGHVAATDLNEMKEVRSDAGAYTARLLWQN